MSSKKVYYSKDSHGNNRYDNLTQSDRIKLRDCRDSKRKLTSDEKLEIFGSRNPVFIQK